MRNTAAPPHDYDYIDRDEISYHKLCVPLQLYDLCGLVLDHEKLLLA